MRTLTPKDRGSPRTSPQREAAIRDGPHVNAEAVSHVVFAILGRHVTPGELADVKRSLPVEVCALWPS
jgi:uncharacterized protein (DUF2267 family)